MDAVTRLFVSGDLSFQPSACLLAGWGEEQGNRELGPGPRDRGLEVRA